MGTRSEQLAIDLRRYEAILRASWDAIVCRSTDGTITTWNPAAERLYGYSWSEAIGQPISMLEPDDLRGETAQLFLQASTGPIEYHETVRKHRDGTLIPVALSVSRMLDEDGILVGASTITHDLTEAKQRWEQLRGEQRHTAEGVTLLDALYGAAPIGLAFVDRLLRVIRINGAMSALSSVPAPEQIGRPVSELIPEIWPALEPLFQKVIETGQPVLDVELEGLVPADPGRIHYSLTSLYPVRLYSEPLGIGVVAVDITARKESERTHSELTRAAVGALAGTVEARDPYTAGHMLQVANLSVAIAIELGVDPDIVEGIRLAASIHDVGKVSVPAEILSSPRRLTPVEFELVKVHPQAGHDIVAGITFRWPIAEMIRQHHERCDGSGYPRGLTREDTHLGSRIIAVADVVEAMSSHRPYRPSKGLAAALEEITRERGRLFDPAAVDACSTLFAEGRFNLEGWGP